jgi:GDPmannose 4,6-dehydratase
MNLLESVRLVCSSARVYQASSSEMFGNSFDEDGFRRETTPMHPTSPYGCAKLFAYNLMRNYRNSYGLFLSNGILFNHESPRRGTNFVTNKVVKESVKIKKGLSDKLMLGNLDAARDWGHAKDYVYCMWLILQHDEPDDFVCSTGVSHTIKELVGYVFSKLDLDWKKYVGQDERYYRPEELDVLKGDCYKAQKILGWKHIYTFETMLDEMLDYWNNYYD